VHGVTASELPASPYVGLVTRTIAFAIDAALINLVAIFVGGVVALVFSILPSDPNRHDVLVVVGGVAFAVWVIGYFLAFWTTTGQTPGNRQMRIRVVRADGSRMRPRHALARLVGVVLSAPLLIGFLPILVTERRRGLHDWMAGTVVTAEPREMRAPASRL
jgi:uncharacterized RDD family membrane protein YckC